MMERQKCDKLEGMVQLALVHPERARNGCARSHRPCVDGLWWAGCWSFFACLLACLLFFAFVVAPDLLSKFFLFFFLFVVLLFMRGATGEIRLSEE